MRLVIAALVLSLTTTAVSADTIAGRASVIDGDTIEIHGERIRFLDIDTPESRQPCTRPDGEEWRCGQQAALALSDWIGASVVTCETDKLDRYKRHLAHCAIDGSDVAEWLAESGWGVPYRDCKCEVVRSAADQAKAARLGIWAGTFIMPWEWRAQESAGEQPTAQPTIKQTTPPDSSACLIKGNISSKGERIYHVPGGKWYDATSIDKSKGERWFCSETEARAAGWRPSKQ
jgi:endonuclease YncB( thermonuclease family)